MFVDEHSAKQLLAQAGLPVPTGGRASTAEQAVDIARRLQVPVVIKALVPAGGRGHAGGVRFAEEAEAAGSAAAQLLGSVVQGHHVDQLIVEEQIAIAAEFYAAIVTNSSLRCPVLLFSPEGGVHIEQLYAERPAMVLSLPVDLRYPLEPARVQEWLGRHASEHPGLAGAFVRLYGLYTTIDAELLEVNPLAWTQAGDLVALDCKLVVDDGALVRHPELSKSEAPGTALERLARTKGLTYIELDGEVGVLANGAGLTMATMDAIESYGGRPANFLEVGGDAYTKAAAALEIVVSHRQVRSLLINLCGAFARTDIIVEAVVTGWRKIAPSVPVAASVHGTGEERAAHLLRDGLGVEPFETMDDAVIAAVMMARRSAEGGDGTP